MIVDKQTAAVLSTHLLSTDATNLYVATFT